MQDSIDIVYNEIISLKDIWLWVNPTSNYSQLKVHVAAVKC